MLFQTKIPGADTNSLTTRMYINNDGKIGINTTSPTHQLHVNGNTFLSGVSTITNLLTTNISSSNIINTNSIYIYMYVCVCMCMCMCVCE